MELSPEIVSKLIEDLKSLPNGIDKQNVLDKIAFVENTIIKYFQSPERKPEFDLQAVIYVLNKLYQSIQQS